MNELSLFSGAGGTALATKWFLGWRTICYVEIHPYAAKVLQARIAEGWLDDAPIWDNVRTFDGKRFRGLVDVISAGFPCQPYSVAGERRADADERNGWPDTIRIIREVRPRYCFLENVPGLLSSTGRGGERYFGKILGDLAESGYDARWRVLSAAELGANHIRKRLWIVAHAQGEPLGAGFRSNQPGKIGGRRLGHGGSTTGEVANASGTRLSQPEQERQHGRSTPQSSWWDAEPGMGRVVNGLAHRVDRIKALGNGQVPAVAAHVWNLLTEELRDVDNT